jgi:HlyD family secretion protein
VSKQRKSRIWLMFATGILVAITLALAFKAHPVMIDTGKVERLPMIVTINEEAKTRVRNAYVVSTPIAGRVLRVDVEPGDTVIGGETVIARMLPINPSALDVRTREQALAAVKVAEARILIARADLNKAIADKKLADLELKRNRKLYQSKSVSQSILDQSELLLRVSYAGFDTAKAAISMREAELANARSRLISFSESPPLEIQSTKSSEAIPLKAPVSGLILRVIQKSEITLDAGSPILEIGDISNDLEIVAELLSTDSVQVAAGNRVIIEKWGHSNALNGTIERVEPWGFTKFSALGVEEQRVNTIIKFNGQFGSRQNLGHGFRVEVRIIIWENQNTLTVPSSALFRDKDEWAVFVVKNGQAKFKAIKVDHNNGVHAEVISGLDAGQSVILYPGPGIKDGMLVAQRAFE